MQIILLLLVLMLLNGVHTPTGVLMVSYMGTLVET